MNLLMIFPCSMNFIEKLKTKKLPVSNCGPCNNRLPGRLPGSMKTEKPASNMIPSSKHLMLRILPRPLIRPGWLVKSYDQPWQPAFRFNNQNSHCWDLNYKNQQFSAWSKPCNEQVYHATSENNESMQEDETSILNSDISDESLFTDEVTSASKND